jgi:hypothetical protein
MSKRASGGRVPLGLGRIRWFAACLGLIAVVAGLQLVASTTPAQLIGTDQGRVPANVAYRLKAMKDGSLRVKLYGEVSATALRRVTLVSIADSSSDPIRPPERRFIVRQDATHVLVLKPKVPPGTYKLRIPGYRPFGLVSIR